MKLNSTTHHWQNLYNEFQSCIGQLPFELFVLSDYEDDGGTFLIVSPLFDTFLPEERERWIEDITDSIQFGQWLGTALTPTELVKLSDVVPVQTSLYPYVLHTEAM